VLVVDDDEAYRTILTRHLAPFCERVEVTGDPRAGLAAARGGQVDCIVLDLMMPEIDGFALLTQIRAEAATARLPVVLCSSRTLSIEEQALARRLHAPFLPKDGLTAERIARALLEAYGLQGVLPQEATRGAA
jgi:CheY-like chemotaxis protein